MVVKCLGGRYVGTHARLDACAYMFAAIAISRLFFVSSDIGINGHFISRLNNC